MKLKKIVSLALAGVMAVSMLAGCANNGGNGGNDSGKEPVTQPAAFNDAQSSTNKAKVVFSNDASLDAALAKAVKINGQGADEYAVESDVRYITGILNTGLWIEETNTDKSVDGATATVSDCFVINSANAWTEEAAINMAAEKADEYIAALIDTTYEKGVTEADETYYDYSYTGKVSMVKVDNTTGTTDYYFFYAVTQTCKAEVLD